MKNRMERIASIDIGTQSIRLLIADPRSNNGKPIERVLLQRRITRLGEGFSSRPWLESNAMERSLMVLDEYVRILSLYGVKWVQAVATSAVREAENGEEFVDVASKRTRIDIRVITAQEEAYLTALGVLANLKSLLRSGDSVVVDIGGGSTELIWAPSGKGFQPISIPVGMVKLTEVYINSDPPLIREVKEAEKAIETELLPIPRSHLLDPLLGTAGTINTLAAMAQRLEKYDERKINGYPLTKGQVEEILNELLVTPVQKRIGRPGLERGREDVILAGALITRKIMEWLGCREIIASDWGLLEGILLREQVDGMIRGHRPQGGLNGRR